MDLTVLLITYNEEPNLIRVLDQLKWAPKVLMIDSGSTDVTLSIAALYSNVEVVYRKFDTFALQCNYGMYLILPTLSIIKYKNGLMNIIIMYHIQLWI